MCCAIRWHFGASSQHQRHLSLPSPRARYGALAPCAQISQPSLRGVAPVRFRRLFRCPARRARARARGEAVWQPPENMYICQPCAVCPSRGSASERNASYTSPDPFDMPALSGGLLAMWRDWWEESGTYDEQMTEWGGDRACLWGQACELATEWPRLGAGGTGMPDWECNASGPAPGRRGLGVSDA